jgi:hypothetical protein
MKATYKEVKEFQKWLRQFTGSTEEDTKEREAFFSKPRISIMTRLDKPSVSNEKDNNNNNNH